MAVTWFKPEKAVHLLTGFLSHRSLVWELAFYDFRAQYLGSVLGLLWGIIHPIAIISVYALIFSSLGPLGPGGGHNITNFGLYIFCGMLPWMAVQTAVQRGVSVFTDQAGLLKQHNLPRFILPLQVTLSAHTTGLIAVIAFLLVNLAVQGQAALTCVLLILILPFQILMAFGMSLVVSTLNVYFRDLTHLTGVAMTVWLFLTPIVYPEESLTGMVKDLMWLNPLYPLVIIYRALLLTGNLPRPEAVAALIVYSGTVFWLGSLFYGRSEKDIVDWV